MKKGKKVRCLFTQFDIGVTKGQIYEVVAGEGDFGRDSNRILVNNEFEFIDDDGDFSYDLFPRRLSNNKWEIIE
jgi:hypothetical protein